MPSAAPCAIPIRTMSSWSGTPPSHSPSSIAPKPRMSCFACWIAKSSIPCSITIGRPIVILHGIELFAIQQAKHDILGFGAIELGECDGGVPDQLDIVRIGIAHGAAEGIDRGGVVGRGDLGERGGGGDLHV